MFTGTRPRSANARGCGTRAPRKRALLGCLAVLSLLAGASPAQEAGAGLGLDRLPQVWRDDAGKKRTLAEFRGHREHDTMAYASCHRICPATMEQLKRMQAAADRHGEAVEFLVVGYDPANDTPTVWHDYRLSRRLTRENWHFLSGSGESVRRLAQQLGFPFWTMEDHVMHDSRAVIFDADGIERLALGTATSRWADAL
jgi:cytochrome oxidase Cu insertion factor (SCO1/SenC/PrrC family)